VPSHNLPSNASLKNNKIVRKYEELIEHYDGTMNQLHMLSFTTDASNDVFTFKQTYDQKADLLTKPLPDNIFFRL
jgi:hypothetical protein